MRQPLVVAALLLAGCQDPARNRLLAPSRHVANRHQPLRGTSVGAPAPPPSGPWTPVSLQSLSGGFAASTMFQLTDGRILVHSENTTSWAFLTPDSTGSYANGTWTLAPSSGTPRLYYASAVLSDGRVVIVGGEYAGGATPTEDPTSEIFDPLTGMWQTLAPIGWPQVGDAPCAILPDGRMLIGSIVDTRSVIWDPDGGTYANAGGMLAAAAEESWVLLPSGSVLAVDDDVTNRAQESEIWSLAGGWTEGGAIPVALVESSFGGQPSEEIGPGILLADGRAFYAGATGHTAYYTPSPVTGQAGSWAAGPDLPLDAGAQVVSKDAPGLLLPNGHVLLALATEDPMTGYGDYTEFDELDPVANTITSSPTAPNPQGFPPYEGRFMIAASGELMFTQGQNQVAFAAAIGGTPAVVVPNITSSPMQVLDGGSYVVAGTGFTGSSQTVAYGDDAETATNYPLARVTHTATQRVTYLRTHDHSTMGVATGTALVSTHVDVPKTLAVGSYQLQVVVNGVASAPVPLLVGDATCVGCVDGAGTCQAGNLNNQCGRGGFACSACPALQFCVDALCQPCVGCVDTMGNCRTTGTNTACGTGGGTCAVCGSTQTCVNAVCQNCAGCIDATGSCDPGTSAAACGGGGQTCQACGNGKTCANGGCQACNGCVDGQGGCQPGKSGGACGTGGQICEICLPGQVCLSSGCQVCSGCVDTGGLCQPGTAITACGANAGTCAVCQASWTCVQGVCTPPKGCGCASGVDALPGLVLISLAQLVRKRRAT